MLTMYLHWKHWPKVKDYIMCYQYCTIESGFVYIQSLVKLILKILKQMQEGEWVCVYACVCARAQGSLGNHLKNKNYKCAKIFIWTTFLDGNSIFNSQTWCTYWSLGMPS